MKTYAKFLFALMLTSVIIYSCKKDRKDDPQPNPTPTISVGISGTVIDAYGWPLTNVTIKVGNQTYTTDNSGTFYIQNASFATQRYTITFEKQGYFTLQRSGQLTPGKPVVINVGLIAETDPTYAAQKQFSSSQADSVVLPNGSVVSFPANAFVTTTGSPYNGTVTVKACYLDPTWNKYPIFTFNGDLYGIDSTNNEVMLNPFAGLNVVLEDANGNRLQLDSANNKKALVKMKIPAQLVANAPNQVEMWVYAPQQGAKQGKGSAVKTGDSYQCEVMHFTYWSCEESYDHPAYVEGRVLKTINGVETGMGGVPIIIANQLVFTDNIGFYKATVPAGLSGISIAPQISSVQPHIITNALTDGEVYTKDFVITQGSNLYAIYGTVRSANLQPLANALVRISYYNPSNYSNVNQLVYTNSAGKYQVLVDGTANSFNIEVKYGNQVKFTSINGPITQDTQIDHTMPPTPGRNMLKVGSNVIFDITGNPSNGYLSAYVSQYLSVYVSVDNNSFMIASQPSATIPPTIGTEYNIPQDYNVTIMYYTLRSNEDSLNNGKIKFTQFSNTGLVSGEFYGYTYNTGIRVDGKFSVPVQTLLRKKNE